MKKSVLIMALLCLTLAFQACPVIVSQPRRIRAHRCRYGYARIWIPGHYNWKGIWISGHWKIRSLP